MLQEKDISIIIFTLLIEGEDNAKVMVASGMM